MTRQFPPAIICIGRNYAAHARELGNPLPERPLVFMKNPASLIGDGEAIIIPPVCREGGEQVDYEGELAIIVGRDARDLGESEALSCLSGYAVANDVSARWWQKKGAGGQYMRGKSFDTFCPMSVPVPAEEVPDPQDLTIRTTVNGVCVQEASTADMIFTVAELLATLSRGMTLLAGTVILTGTPAGVGAGRTPPVYLRAGDRVEVSIDGVGQIGNPVREDD